MRGKFWRLLAIVFVFLMAVPEAALADPPVAEGQRAIDLMWSCEGRGKFYDLASKAKMKDASFFGTFDLHACVEYLEGIVDANAMYIAMGRPGLFCLPKVGLVREQQILVFQKWAKAYPERLHETRRSAVFTAFANTFPCRQK